MGGEVVGVVHIDINKKEREYMTLTVSDAEVVKYLILYRSKVDVAYGADININIKEAGDMFEFNQELICLYVSLDKIIAKLNLNEKEMNLLKLVFEGNTIPDIIKHYNIPSKTAYRIFNKIVNKIVEQNYEEWKGVMKRNGFIEEKEGKINE